MDSLGLDADAAAGADCARPCDTFVDDFIINIPDAQDVSFFVSTVGFQSGRKVLPQVSFAGFVLDGNLHRFDGVRAQRLRHREVRHQRRLDALATGTYALEITGTINANGGSYSGLLGTTPSVPEPAGWALMMAGFGAMGMLARRRKNQG